MSQLFVCKNCNSLYRVSKHIIKDVYCTTDQLYCHCRHLINRLRILYSKQITRKIYIQEFHPILEKDSLKINFIYEFNASGFFKEPSEAEELLYGDSCSINKT